VSLDTIAYGYFDSPGQTEPVYDPGLEVLCPICSRVLSERPRTTISTLRAGLARSLFYRVHRDCYDGVSEEVRDELERRLWAQFDEANQ
jgi:hypothetical protein